MKEFWEKRYNSKEYIYGSAPNAFLKSQLGKLPAGKLLLPAEGEGRNAVYAAELGWDVDAIDFSEQGKEKALRLAKERNVYINYQVADLSNFEFKQSYDVIGLIYAHFPAEWRSSMHQELANQLNSGGIIILEAFHKDQLGKDSGGPKSLEMLYSKESIRQDFKSLHCDLIKQETIFLDEGKHHSGEASVVRCIFRKS